MTMLPVRGSLRLKLSFAVNSRELWEKVVNKYHVFIVTVNCSIEWTKKSISSKPVLFDLLSLLYTQESGSLLKVNTSMKYKFPTKAICYIALIAKAALLHTRNILTREAFILIILVLFIQQIKGLPKEKKIKNQLQNKAQMQAGQQSLWTCNGSPLWVKKE